MSEKPTRPTMGMKRDETTGEVTFDAREALQSMGGISGLIETTIPGAAYVAAYLLTKNVVLSVAIAASLSVVSLIAQIARKRSVIQAVAGGVGIVVAAYLPLSNPSQPASYFIPGFFTNVAYGGVLLVSLLVRYPLIGFVLSFLNGKTKTWRSDRSSLRRYNFATALWVALFAGRLAVQLPFYFANNLLALGVAKEVMGLPLYGLCLWFTWLLVRSEFSKPANGNFESDSRE